MEYNKWGEKLRVSEIDKDYKKVGDIKRYQEQFDDPATCTNTENSDHPLIDLKTPKDEDGFYTAYEPHNQRDVGWCYAVTAADIMSQFTGVKVNYADMAIQYNAHYRSMWDRTDENEGGQVGRTLRLMNEQGLCPSNGSEIPNSYDKELMNFFIALQNLLDDAPSGMFDFLSKERQQDRHNEVAEFISKSLCDNIETLPFHDLFPDMELNEFAQIIMKAYKNDSTVVEEFLDKKCEPRMEIPFKLNIVTDKCLIRSCINNLDQQLDKGRIVGLSYHSKILYSPFQTNRGGYHASTVVGRKFNKESKKCEYIIRNSYGKSCEIYYKEYKCVDGHIYIPRSILNQTMFAIDYID